MSYKELSQSVNKHLPLWVLPIITQYCDEVSNDYNATYDTGIYIYTNYSNDSYNIHVVYLCSGGKGSAMDLMLWADAKIDHIIKAMLLYNVEHYIVLKAYADWNGPYLDMNSMCQRINNSGVLVRNGSSISDSIIEMAV